MQLLLGASIVSQTLAQNRRERSAGSIQVLGWLEPAGISLYGYICVGRKFLSLLSDPHLHQSSKWFGAKLASLGSWNSIFIAGLIRILVFALVEVGAIVLIGLALGGQWPILRWLGDFEQLVTLLVEGLTVVLVVVGGVTRYTLGWIKFVDHARQIVRVTSLPFLTNFCKGRLLFNLSALRSKLDVQGIDSIVQVICSLMFLLVVNEAFD